MGFGSFQMDYSGSASKQAPAPKMVVFLLQVQQTARHNQLTTELSNYENTEVINVN